MIIRHKSSYAMIGDLGATIQQWCNDGQHILYPEQLELKNGVLKRRGGCPILIPQFGKVVDNGRYAKLPQHGFLRDKVWYSTCHTDTISKYTAACLGSDQVLFPFKFRVEAITHIGLNRLKHNIRISNEEKDIPIPFNPGLHPYFRTPLGGFGVSIGKERVEGNGSFSTQSFAAVEEVNITLYGLGSVTMTLGGEFLRHNAQIFVWTDSTDYVCVEPVLDHPGRFATKRGCFVQPGQSIECKCMLRFAYETDSFYIAKKDQFIHNHDVEQPITGIPMH